MRTATVTKIKGLSIQTQQNTFVLFTSFKLTLDEHKTLTKISMRKPLTTIPQTSTHLRRQLKCKQQVIQKRAVCKVRGETSFTPLPPEFRVGTDKEFFLCNFHHHKCLMRQSFNLEGRHRQLAFCPYSNTALSHMRKHLDLQFVCGGCCSKSFLNGPALNKHMKTQCASVTATRDRSKPSRW